MALKNAEQTDHFLRVAHVLQRRTYVHHHSANMALRTADPTSATHTHTHTHTRARAFCDGPARPVLSTALGFDDTRVLQKPGSLGQQQLSMLRWALTLTLSARTKVRP